MKKQLYLLITISSFFACNKKNNDGVKLINISENKTESIVSTIWQEADSNRFYYDLRVTESYFVFLDDKSDTIIHIYKQDNPREVQNYYIKKERSLLHAKLQFLKTNTRNIANDNQLWIVENNVSIKTINPGNSAEQLLSPITDYLFTNLPNSTDFNLTKDEIYAVPLNFTYNSPYYFYQPDSGFFRAEIYKHPEINYPKTSLAYLTCLIVSEENKTVVSAQRFMNDILFYDLSGNLQKVLSFGKEHTIPIISNNTVDMEKSKKCFIYICSTNKNVYCLYDGSTDYTALSKIVVFNWSGKHIKTYQTDRCLKQIAVNKEETEIIALAANEHSGRDVVLFKMK